MRTFKCILKSFVSFQVSVKTNGSWLILTLNLLLSGIFVVEVKRRCKISKVKNRYEDKIFRADEKN